MSKGGAALIEQLRHACSVALGDLLAQGMPAEVSTGKMLVSAIGAAEKHLTATQERADYTQTMRRDDHDAFVALIEKQSDLYRQLETISQDLRTLAGKVHDHAAGFQHKPETCATCARAEAA